MKKQIILEYKKMWNKVTWLAMAAMCTVVILHLVIYLSIQWRTIDNNGQIVEGLASWRTLREVSKETEGVMDGDYIKNLAASYNNSFDKAYLKENRGFLGTGGMSKYMEPNYFINYAYYGPYMSNGNDKFDLDYDFLDSEETFYRAYKDAVKEEVLMTNEVSGLSPLTDTQKRVLEKKIENLRTPVTTGYIKGLANVRAYFLMDYALALVVVVFGLAGLFAKDYTAGITELTLSARYGRKVNMNARWIAGNLFLVSAYLIYIGIQLLGNGIIATLDGWNVSAQMMWFHCVWNITMGEGLLVMFTGGLLGLLVIGNLMMFISMKLKNIKLAAVLSVLAVYFIMKTEYASDLVRHASPICFNKDFLLEEYLFLGNAAIPYFAVIIVLAVLYMAVLRFGIKLSYKKYYIN